MRRFSCYWPRWTNWALTYLPLIQQQKGHLWLVEAHGRRFEVAVHLSERWTGHERDLESQSARGNAGTTPSESESAGDERRDIVNHCGCESGDGRSEIVI